MTIEQFIAENSFEIDEYVVSNYGVYRNMLDDEEREMWILNCLELYEWALEEGVEGI